ncbi:1-deoxy-D-xylulose-5-phosphate reductoisomerase [Pelagibacteraceae bacterium]|jgi:1-deoxy-D-xylulose-5-phosphate reductoisomerase|nr:1-deoxy-D-xylulose-5-phosphate reductoisomerase [Pelagibacteraceae bacterium]
MKKTISILGSTGSIGTSLFKIIDNKAEYFNVHLLSANKKYNLICKQIKKYNPKYFIISDPNVYRKVKIKFKKRNITILNNFDEIKDINKTDIVVSAIPGLAGLIPTILAIRFTKKILIANKESIICGWNLIKKAAYKYKTKIIPVDSEHFSILKLLQNHKLYDIKKIYITASGGPFLNFNVDQLKKITIKDALKHPKWKMGKKISIDSSTLMNKVLELIEAQKLFNIPNNKIDILIHPDSLVHAIIKLKNGLTKFIYHETSMIIPLANAIFEDNLDIEVFYKKKKKKSKPIESLIFQEVDKTTFPIIKLKNRLNEYPSTPIIINSSNEILVEQFLAKKIHFLSIYKIIMTILNNRNYKKYAIRKPKNIYQIKKIDEWARAQTMKKINKNLC